jgi:hypothetical protein
MPSRTQFAILIALGLAMWGAATLLIRLWPAAFTDPLLGAAGFAAMLPVGWLSVWLIARLAGLTPDRVMAGVAVVGATAMCIDGVVLRWAPLVYGDGDLPRLAGAWLLWGYGVSLAIALTFARRTA